MRAVKILLRVITLVVVLTVSSAAALASPAVSDNYQKIPLNGLNVGGTLVDDSVWAFPEPPDTELQNMIKEDAGNGLCQLLGNSEILTAWQARHRLVPKTSGFHICLSGGCGRHRGGQRK